MNAKNLIRASLADSMTLPIAGTALADAANDTEYDSVSGNVALTSDYMFRGLTQTWGGPAIQGGGDLTMKNGFAAGFWASSISDKSYPGASLELDLYANYGTQINDDWSWRVGLYSYLYPNGNLDDVGLPSRSFNTTEANASLTWKWLTLKYSDVADRLFRHRHRTGLSRRFQRHRLSRAQRGDPVQRSVEPRAARRPHTTSRRAWRRRSRTARTIPTTTTSARR